MERTGRGGQGGPKSSIVCYGLLCRRLGSYRCCGLLGLPREPSAGQSIVALAANNARCLHYGLLHHMRSKQFRRLAARPCFQAPCWCRSRQDCKPILFVRGPSVLRMRFAANTRWHLLANAYMFGTLLQKRPTRQAIDVTMYLYCTQSHDTF